MNGVNAGRGVFAGESKAANGLSLIGTAGLAGLVFLMTSLDRLPPLTSVGRGGFQLASIGAVCLFVFLAVRKRPVLRAAWHGNKRLVVAAILVTVMAAIAAIGATNPRLAWATAAGAGLTLCYGGAVLEMCRRAPETRRVLGLAGLSVIGLFSLGYVLALLVPTLRSEFFEIGRHQHVGTLERYRGLMMSPSACGHAMLCSVGLVQHIPSVGLRRSATVVGLILCGLSLSFSALALPFLLMLWLVRSPVLRRVMAAGAATVALCILLINPLELKVGSASVQLGHLHPSYYTNGMGPLHTPIRELTFGAVHFRYHASHYTQVMDVALRCVLDHPLTGVGGYNFNLSCPILTMDSYGKWAPRRAHNFYTGTLVERGILGLLSVAALAFVLARRYRWRADRAAHSALLFTHLLCGFAAQNWFQYSLAAWLGTSLVLRDDETP